MRRHFIISLDEIKAVLRPQVEAMARMGFDVHGLFAYSVHAATASDFETLKQHLIRDIAHSGLDISPQLVYQCVDFVGDAARNIVPIIERAVGKFDHTVRFEQILGRDAVISVSEFGSTCDYAPNL